MCSSSFFLTDCVVHSSSVFIPVCFICQKNARFADRCFSPNDDFNRVVSKEAASVDSVCKAPFTVRSENGQCSVYGA